MKLQLFKNFAVLLALGMLFGACEKEVGPKGETGPQGEKGTANVIYSDWLPVPTTPSGNLPNRKNFSFAAPHITQEVIDNGLVYAYLKHQSSPGMTPLPYAGKYVLGTDVIGSYLTTILLGVGSISLNQDWLTPGNIPAGFANSSTVNGGFTHLRYVVVPGGQRGSSASVDFNDYESVKKHFNLGE